MLNGDRTVLGFGFDGPPPALALDRTQDGASGMIDLDLFLAGDLSGDLP